MSTCSGMFDGSSAISGRCWLELAKPSAIHSNNVITKALIKKISPRIMS